MAGKQAVAVLGAGSWGTALAHHLGRAGFPVLLWGRDSDVLQGIASHRENTRYLPGVSIHPAVQPTFELAEAVRDAAMVVFAVPSTATRELARSAKDLVPPQSVVVSTAKGLDAGTLDTMSAVLGSELGGEQRIVALSGPSFALEVVQGMPTAVVIAAKEASMAKQAADVFHHEYFRVYTSTDLLGVEISGAAKNVIALAAGVVDGCGMGNNARAALITRGVAEMKRLVEAVGGDRQTASGLSGLGDLLLTSTGDLSRNRRVGLKLGAGEQLPQIIAEIGQTAEATRSAALIAQLGRRHSVTLPIIDQVELLLAGNRTVQQALTALFARELRSE
ncbi:MAG: NAD(P)-dependent glycerol-3-phosphate dehydrogenase [Bdellovibrionales bacterium]|nr:NAD(P)-dependent glycerol-3-phosphate dehydrogenase [Bdellovibrionales bacterium]